MSDDDLSDFDTTTFRHDGKTRTIFRKGSGPAVIVIAEMPGISPKVADFARKVADIGCTAVMPHLYGEPGRDPESGGIPGALRYTMSSMIPACVSREFTVWASGKTSPIVDWLRALSRDEHERCGGPGVGAIGMCFTGGFALAMATEPALVAPVLSQPSLPISPKGRRSIDCSPADLDIVKGRCAAEGLQIIGMRFTSDRLVGPHRFDYLRDQLGDNFRAIELDDADANPGSRIPPHSVVTEHLIDEPGSRTRAALDEVLDLFRTKLLV